MLSLEYIAGLVDGEGYIGIIAVRTKTSRSGYYFRPAVKISLTQGKEVLKEIAERFHGDYFYRKQTGNRKDLHDVRLQGRYTEHFIKSLLPYLKIKHTQAQVFLKFFKYMGSSSEPSRTNQQLLAQAEVCNELRKLNARGRREPNLLQVHIRAYRKPEPAISREKLYDLYWNERLSSDEIVEKLGLHRNSVYYWLHKHNIPRRTRSECSKLAHQKYPERMMKGLKLLGKV